MMERREKERIVKKFDAATKAYMNERMIDRK